MDEIHQNYKVHFPGCVLSKKYSKNSISFLCRIPSTFSEDVVNEGTTLRHLDPMYIGQFENVGSRLPMYTVTLPTIKKEKRL